NTLLQWWRMGNANNFEEFESALKMAQIPFWNVMYADKAGNIFYLFNGLIPVRKEGGWDYWDRVIPGGKSEDVWTAVHPYSDLPQIKNPPQGWLQNANDPPWTSTFPMLLNPDDFPPYTAPKGMPFRPQRAVRMLDEDESITFDELVDYKLSTRLEMADRLLDDLFAAVDQYGTAKGKEAKAVLENWDRQSNNESVGTLLFTQWALAMQVWDENTFATKWDENSPRTTPDGLADPKKAAKTLEAVADDIIKKHGGLQVPWGDVYRLHYNSIDLPGNGANGLFGAFRVAWPGRVENNKTQISGGDSWVGIIEFGDSIKAKVLLSYGNSSQKESPHNGDQLKLFSERKLRDALFYPEDLEGNIKGVEVLENGKFVEKK
ncbi:MAG: penicillin acylase family protein, partial [Cyclobacteriaceae bacterium]